MFQKTKECRDLKLTSYLNIPYKYSLFLSNYAWVTIGAYSVQLLNTHKKLFLMYFISLENKERK